MTREEAESVIKEALDRGGEELTYVLSFMKAETVIRRLMATSAGFYGVEVYVPKGQTLDGVEKRILTKYNGPSE